MTSPGPRVNPATRQQGLKILTSLIRHPLRWARWLSIDDRRAANVKRWTDLGNFDPGWDERTHKIAARLRGAQSIIEFGAGRCTLRAALAVGTEYVASDVVSRGPDTLVWDLNNGAPPLDRHFDAAVFSGVLEYVEDVAAVVRGLYPNVDQIITSYASINDVSDHLTRRENGWVNHLTCAEFVALVESCGYRLRGEENWIHSRIYDFGHDEGG